MLRYAPPQNLQLPLKTFSPFLTEMAKGARIAQILSQIPTPWSRLQFVMIMQ